LKVEELKNLSIQQTPQLKPGQLFFCEPQRKTVSGVS
jgi:hypothetical protein